MTNPGKIIGRRTYLHLDALPALDEGRRADWERAIAQAEQAAEIVRGEQFNVVRLDADGQIALLHYADFFDDPFPTLRESWRFEPSTGEVGYRTYADSLNPPILHRKELLLPADHPRRDEYAALTAAAESIGLFDDTTRIGYQRQWLALVREKGYRIDGHALVPLGNVEGARDEIAPGGSKGGSGEEIGGESGGGTGGGTGVETSEPLHTGWEAARQLTAMVRYGFSAPVQSLARHGFLDGRYRLFDYGCGRGDDLRGLRENGISAAGWDPYYAPDGPIEPADIVNLGFVINVIEDFDERLEALTRAWSLAERLLVVSVMLANQNDPRGDRFRDGVLTKRGTFQKYYSQAEIKAFLTQALDEEPIAVAPGVLYVFRDKDSEQRFLLERYRRRGNRLREPSARLRPVREPRQRRDRAAEQYAAYQSPLERLWDDWLSLGRKPDKAEVADLLTLAEGFGSLGKALRFLEAHKRTALGDEMVDGLLGEVASARVADLEVYFALMQFERRRPYKHLEPGLQRDIKQFFGDYGAAQSAGWARLLQIADVQAIGQACREAAEHGLGWLERGGGAPEDADGEQGARGSLQLHASLVEQLPALLRIYAAAAAMLYGDWRSADLVKIHIGSGKLTLMRFDDFDGQPLPRLLERVKIRLREQEFDYFGYGDDYEPPFLYWKSRYINEEDPGYPQQLAFDEALDGLGLLDLSGYGPAPRVLLDTLARHRWTLDGFQLCRSLTPPALDDTCGRFLSFRQLIECGETWEETRLENLPKAPESWNALLELAEQVLDPVIDWFGMIRLTYGFCSPALARRIPGRIDPKRDQHAAHERNRLGNPVCERLGAAVDFVIDDEDMLEVARWIVEHTPFDRLYFYGPNLPIHVSYGPQHSRQVVLMRPGKSGRLVPKVVSVEQFLCAGVSPAAGIGRDRAFRTLGN
ncbi:DNA phosphorothioation-associated putative methyltransferase [Thiohalocapsa marina]|uniref:DNA phosphorothioation-associated putative methyltransferase n=1 Tax=Thiohalocapsa marina TaxID=424902 RepID=A0A5M8FI78_9GAMM|nr:DNA phosphorothioation-associated putative methyltransferase [Thiohalocapsa marina]KAA6182245.1 DNA phosphorothioation-associated putative methyltransferase [Thiohalocapsa marina]